MKKHHWSFSLSDTERQSLSQWCEAHETETQHFSTYGGAIGGAITLSFTPSSVGVFSVVRCNRCGKEHHLTDFDLW